MRVPTSTRTGITGYKEVSNPAAETAQIEQRLMKVYEEGLAIGGMSNLSVGTMAANAGAHNEQAILKKKESDKQALEAAMAQSLQETIDGLKEQIARHKENIGALDNAITRLREGADPQDVADDPKIKKLIKEHEARTGKKVDPNSPDFIEVLTVIQSYEREQVEAKTGLVNDLNQLDGSVDNTAAIQASFERHGVDLPAKVEAASNVMDQNIQEQAYVAAGYEEENASWASDRYDESGTSADPYGYSESSLETSGFEGPPPLTGSYAGPSAAASLHPDGNMEPSRDIKLEYNNAAANNEGDLTVTASYENNALKTEPTVASI